MKLAALLLTVLLFVCLVPSTEAQEIPVRLFDSASPRQISIAALDGEVRLFAGEFEDPLMTLSSGEEAIISRASDQLHVHLGDMRLYATSLHVEPLEGARLGLAVREGRQLTESRRYSGLLRISPDDGNWELRIINVVPLEEYVAGVVSSEYGFDDLEGSKAMAVLARTYALSTANAALHSDVELSDHTLSQVYRGSGEITDVVREAVRQTNGEVATYEGTLIEAVYFSSSGGHTASNDDVWESRPLPYLRGRPDPYDTASPHSQWSARIPRAELLSALSDAYEAPIEGFVLGTRSTDGRVASVELIQKGGRKFHVRANEFRLHVINKFGARSLRSTLFDARRDADAYVFEGRGYGHGVGLSQWGAHEMARQGKGYHEILNFYYTDIEVAGFEEATAFAPPVQQVVSRPKPEAPAEKADQRIGW